LSRGRSGSDKADFVNWFPMTIDQLGLRTFTLNRLKNPVVHNDPTRYVHVPTDVAEFQNVSVVELLKIRKFGRSSLRDLQECLRRHGYPDLRIYPHGWKP
jgi:hypothetical protein